MGKYFVLKKEFAFLESEYGFKIYMKQKHGAYYYLTWTNNSKDIMVLYDDRIKEGTESPVWIRIYDANSLGTSYDDVNEFKNEFAIPSGSPKERIRSAASWLKKAILNGIVIIE